MAKVANPVLSNPVSEGARPIGGHNRCLKNVVKAKARKGLKVKSQRRDGERDGEREEWHAEGMACGRNGMRKGRHAEGTACGMAILFPSRHTPVSILGR